MKTKENLWKLSPSGLYGYTECQSCFWADNHFRKAPMLPLLLNSAMDSILKNRFDKYRADGAFPPEMLELEKMDIKPFGEIEKLNDWRENSSALRIVDEKVGYVLSGKIDDVLVEADGRLIPADYKSSGNAPAEDKQKYYADQLAAYGLMFSKNGYPVSDRAYLLHYFVKDKNDGAIDVTFDSHLDLVPIDLGAIEQKLVDMVAVLNGPYPGINEDCDKCTYYAGRSEAITK
ncbi:PD-(D/E)XK nuclease family protein [Candidatus Berkelbacteria bacterium]|nr:PD-(D/E)XK nuclease family protein [Candidatus Berkelbacteria bacterium]